MPCISFKIWSEEVKFDNMPCNSFKISSEEIKFNRLSQYNFGKVQLTTMFTRKNACTFIVFHIVFLKI